MPSQDVGVPFRGVVVKGKYSGAKPPPGGGINKGLEKNREKISPLLSAFCAIARNLLV